MSLASLRATAPEVLDRYCSPSSHYAFNTYDVQGDIAAPLSPSDVLMANLLSLSLRWQEVIPLFAEGVGPQQRLRVALDVALAELKDLPPFESYETYEALEAAVASLSAANTATDGYTKWTPTTVSKVLHRRRPQIVPLNDSYVRTFYGVRNRRDSAALRKALWEDLQEHGPWLTALASTKKTPDGHPLTVLRLADILIWMHMKDRT
ncbi:DUF6308 family protein [Arthrobacter sp. MMS18-M83]|uniref:DUF6308 family protein n=1 Tax=Arthrobacter sp. MMS18-M83 TaxID=2996261 RepID=UPI00227D2A62|nr:DUF6308 family protein [Arthrobacter sp. MMS18-M83]WAH96175.1 DUF6308 family protein [Arthrobacter sp. MMS18-M83]